MTRWSLGLGPWAWGLLLLLCASVAGAQNVNWPSERPPRPLAPRESRFPPYEVRTLSNGLQVIIVLHHEQPVVSMRLLVRAGSLQDPPGKVGVANLASSLLDQGTTARSASQIADQIDFIGGVLGAGSNPDLTFMNAVVMKDSFGVGLDLLADVARNPAFAEEEIDRQKEQILSSLQVNRGDPDYLASVVFDRLVYGFHPYGLPDSGTAETLSRITRADLQAYHRQYFVPNNMILAIVGDVTSQEAFAGAQRVFGGWPRAEVPPVRAVEPPPPTRRVIVIDKPDAVQTEIRAGQLAIARKHPDYMAWDLAVKVLGGEGANRLHRVLRSERGLTYGAAANMRASKYAGDYVAETDTRTETTGEVLRLMVDEFSRLARERVFERELADAQAYLAGSFPITIETPNDIATQVLNVVFYELPIEEIGTFRERVQRVTPDDVQRVARQYVRPDRLSIVLVGNARAFVPQLRQAGFTDFEVIPIEQLDLTEASLRAERRTVARPPEGGSHIVPVSGQMWLPASAGSPAFSPVQAARTDTRAADLLKRVIDAKGGLDLLRKVRTVVADADTAFRIEQGTMQSATRTYVGYPDKFRVDAAVQGAEIVQVYNAGAAWVRDPGGVHDAPPAMAAEFASAVRRDTIPLLIGAAEGKVNVRQLPEEGQDGRVFRVLEFSAEGLPPVKLYIDNNNLITRQAFTMAGPDGRTLQAVEVYSDYRPVDGVQVPFKAELHHNGRPILSRMLTKVAINGPLDNSLFSRPQ
jgi:zinc protease